MTYFAKLEKLNMSLKLFLGFAFIVCIGVVDFITGYEFGFSLFYVLPVSFLTWIVGRKSGIAGAIFSASVWFWADMASGHIYTHSFFPVWNAVVRFSFFTIIAELMSALRNALQHEKELARIDNLTGAVNSRYFFELAQIELDRLQRFKRPFSLAYLDLDNFKAVNDTLGHPIGDRVLCKVCEEAAKKLRKIDVFARLGGDEFAVLMPETDKESARVAIEKLQLVLLEAMRTNDWPITFSIGVLTCTIPPDTKEDLLRLADELMYSVKRYSKNAVTYSEYPG